MGSECNQSISEDANQANTHESMVAITGDVNKRRFYVILLLSHQLFAFFVVTCYQACTWDHSCSTLQREVLYLLHTHYMRLPDII